MSNKLSAVIITYNEERNIARCLDSLSGVADDIVVLDSFSTDNTKEICSKYNVNFIQSEWLGYSETKNLANTKAKFDWILSVDADEALSENLKTSILNAKEKSKTSNYKFNRLTNYCGKWIRHSGWYPDCKFRIFDRREAKWKGMIHETLENKSGKEPELLKGDLLHYSFYNIDEHVKKADYFSTISAKARFENGEKTNFLLLAHAFQIKFCKHYFIKLGFLDGFYGFVIAMVSGYAAFLKQAKLRELWKNKS